MSNRRISTGRAADGLFVREGLFRVLPEASLMLVEELLRARVITFLVERGLLPPDRAQMLRGCLPGTGQTKSCPGRLEAFGPRSCLPDGILAASPP